MYKTRNKINGIILLARDLPESLTKPFAKCAKVAWHKFLVCPLWFHSCCTEVCQVPSSSQSYYHALSSETKHNVFRRGVFSHLRSLPQPDLDVQYHLLSKVGIREQPLTPFYRRGCKGEAIRELIQGLGYSGSSLPS